jgi:hypothetical protein
MVLAKVGSPPDFAVHRAGETKSVWGPRVWDTHSRADICDPNGYHIELRQWFRSADVFTTGVQWRKRPRSSTEVHLHLQNSCG